VAVPPSYYPTHHLSYTGANVAINPGQIYSMDRKSKKNAQSRARAAKLRDRIEQLQKRPESELTEEEKHTLATYEERRRRKNERSRERAIEKKNEIEKILDKPDKKRSKHEEDTLAIALNAKKRKNEGDRLRRERIKMAQMAAAGYSVQSGGTAVGGTVVATRGRGRPRKPVSLPVGAAQPLPMPWPTAPIPQQHTTTAPGSQFEVNSSQVQQHRHADGSLSINIFGHQEEGSNIDIKPEDEVGHAGNEESDDEDGGDMEV